MKIKIEIIGLDRLIEATNSVAKELMAARLSVELAAKKDGHPLEESSRIKAHSQNGSIFTRRKKGPRTGYVRPDNLAKKIAKVTGGDAKQICRDLWADFGGKLVEFDNGRKGFTKATERSIFHLMTNGK